MRSMGAGFLMLILTAPVIAGKYRYIATPDDFVPYAINDHGMMAGTLDSDAAAVLSHGTVRVIADFTVPSGVNNLTEFVLWQSSGSYVYSKGDLDEIVIPDSRHVTANDINDHGVVIGHYNEFAYPWTRHAFVSEYGQVRQVDHPNFEGDPSHLIWFQGNNNVGQLVGTYLGEGGLEGFVYDNGLFMPIPYKRPQDINDLRQIVAIADNGHGLLAGEGVDTEIKFPGAQTTTPKSINNLGQIVGYYQLGGGPNTRYGFVAYPIIPAKVIVRSRQIPAKGGLILVTVEVPSEFSAEEIAWIAIEKINKRSVAPIEPWSIKPEGDRDSNGLEEISLGFRVNDLIAELRPGSNLLVVSGESEARLYFEGSATVMAPAP